ncbi:MAG: radical SAM protein [Proteobacteria bacterium]|nr:radical SAM protein [Pseudomonadota bacterium]MCP4918818.1 radical SAM protein [Pseudomonadota bacterium]
MSNRWIGPQGQRMKRLELHLTYTCPERCVFCSEDHRMQAYKKYPVTWGRVAKTLRLHAKNGINHLHITGGEPTIHPRFLDVLRLAKKLGMRTSVGTIGTRLSDRAFATEALPFLDEALFSIHGASAEVHDPLTRRTGSFDKQMQALELARELRPGFMAAVNTVMCRENVEQLFETVRVLDQQGLDLIVVSNTTPEGAALDAYDDLAVPLSTLMRVLPTVQAQHATLRFFGIPMCVLAPEQRMLSNDLHWDPRVTVEWFSQPGKVVYGGYFTWTPARKRRHVDACRDCSRAGVCVGVYDRYTALWPTPELSPIP